MRPVLPLTFTNTPEEKARLTEKRTKEFKDNGTLDKWEKVKKEVSFLLNLESSNAQFQVSAPILKALGYDIMNPFEVQYSKNLTRKKKGLLPVDIILKPEGERDSRIIIGMAHLGTNLDAVRDTLIYHLEHKKSIKYAIFTSGLEFEVYIEGKKDEQGNYKPFYYFSLETLEINDIILLEGLSRKNYEPIMNLGVNIKSQGLFI